ncbi:MAG: hypothetical protein GY847_34900, partial [Proteobacteria bacterium]|nr:hypothetical protein [Pseudomonadota bacterium]
EPADLRYEGAEGIAVCVSGLDSCELARPVTRIKRQSRPAELRAITTVTPLRKQLTSIRAEKPEADDETACRSVTVQSYAPSNTVVHEAEKLVAELKRIEVKPTIDGPFVIHGNQYQLWIFTAGNHSYFSFSGIPGSADSEMENPLERWADQLLRLIGFKCK